ncbi:MAG: PCRF domain-containing protein [Candidatus Taylorbacteria bacterium]|nr:PCRF domain-containing protein [Candidatus Taylorbacteria bacterium]
MNIEEYKKNHKTAYLAEIYEKLVKDEAEILSMIENDPSMKDMAQVDLVEIQEQKKNTANQIKAILESEKEEIENPTELILEIRAGAGGDEALIFAHELLKMYEKYAETQGWSTKVVDDLTIEIKGKTVYGLLKHETGVHRVQRIPETEKMGRVHTSTASVAILPIRKKVKFEINPTELHVEFSRAGGKGGQNVNKVETAVRIVHIPTGLDVRATAERSQSANREMAMTILTAKLAALKEEEEAKKFSANRKGQIGTADRSEKIRTYNFPQDRITDHRIKESWSNIHTIMAGKLDDIVESLLHSHTP